MPDVTAAPSAAPTQADPSPATNHQQVIDTLTPDQRTAWRMTGELPKAEPAKETPKEDSTPSKAETAAASEPAKTTQEEPKASVRLKEILDDLRKAGLSPSELKTFKREATQPPKQAEPAPAVPEKKGLEPPKKPKLTDFDFDKDPQAWEKMEAAKDKYYEDLTEFRKQEAIEQFKREAQEETARQRISIELEQGRKRYADFDTVVTPVYQRLTTENLDQTVLAMVGNSPVFVDLMYALGEESALNDFVQTAKTNPYLAIRKVVILEGLVQEELAKKTANGKEKETERNDKGQFQATPEKKVTSAPRPPAEVGGTTPPAEDAAQAALQKKDFAAYAREVNRREMAARKGN